MAVSKFQLSIVCVIGGCVLALVIDRVVHQWCPSNTDISAQQRDDSSPSDEPTSALAARKLRLQEQQLESAAKRLYNDG